MAADHRRIIAAIGFLGVFREIVPDVHFARLVPRGVSDTLREGPKVGVSLTAAIAVLLVWLAVWFGLGAWRAVTRDA